MVRKDGVIREEYLDNMPVAFAQIRAVADGSRGGKCIVDYVNNAFEQLFPQKEAVVDDEILSLCEETIATGLNHSLERHGGNPDKHFRISVYRIKEDMCGCILEDITEECRIQQKLNDIAVREGIDSITKLKNRNSYEEYLREFKSRQKKAFFCVYIDVDGLHELNNTLGHDAGDELLRYVAKSIMQCFGRDNSYRIGGDEFVIFCEDMSRDALIKKLDKLKELIAEGDYHISAGVAWCDEGKSPQQTILRAEEDMYSEKKRYYSEKGDVSKSRVMNEKLEKILSQKKDADMFLSVISTYFIGVYIINLDSDEVRVIYRPAYFEEVLAKTNNNFFGAIQIYIDRFVCPEDRASFTEFIRLEELKKQIFDGKIPSIVFNRLDGKNMLLSVYPTADYSLEKPETFWMFEEHSTV